MKRKQALIVDDSKTAQYLLKRMLQSYDMTIDVVFSAEEALAYLSYNHPAVIFLDQQMTGMTGMEALKTIKANPHTALIPVIMYTSQNDDLFVSQAIALGAQGILSKSALQPSNLQQVLARLNFHAQGDNAVLSDDAVELPAVPTVLSSEPIKEAAVTAMVGEASELDKVRSQIGRLFELHIADVRNQISTSAQFVIKRLSTNIDKTTQRDTGSSNLTLAGVKSAVAAAVAAERRKRTLATRLLLAATLATTTVFGYLLLEFQADAKASSRRILAALEESHADKPLLASTIVSNIPEHKAADVAGAVHPSLLQAISWAQNADFHFEYGEQPLSGMRLSNLHQLVHLLAEGGYRGPLIVNINFGNYCLEQDETNTFKPARSEARASSCKLQKDLNPRFLVSDYLTLQYQAFEKNVAPLQDGRISIQLVSSGMGMPGVEYPALNPQISAGEWNRVAQKNNRISVQFPR